MDIEVLKFGGSILKTYEDFERVTNLVVDKRRLSTLPVCVVSAMKGVTDQIIHAMTQGHANNDFDPSLFVKKLYMEHLGSMPENENGALELRLELQKLENVLQYAKSSGEINGSAYAYAVSRGECFSSKILSEHVSLKNISNVCLYGEDLLVTDDNPLDAVVDLKRTEENVTKNLMPWLEKDRVPIVAGFSGRSRKGRVTILGRGGSDDTAASLGYCLKASKVVKHTDADGVMTLDPKFMAELERHPETRQILEGSAQPSVIPYLSYVEASELLREERTKVVHYKVLNPLMKGSICFHIKNVAKPGSLGTVIGPEEDNHIIESYGRPKAISFQRNLSGVKFLPTLSLTPIEVYVRLFETLSRERVDIRYLSTSGYQISLLMPEVDTEKAIRALRGLDIAVDVVPLEGMKGTFSVIGSGMRGVRGFFSKITGVVAKHGINIEQATQPNSENIIRFAVDDRDIPKAVAALYSEFFR
jgi:aspartate kinase